MTLRLMAKRPKLRYIQRPIPGVWSAIHRAAWRRIPDMRQAFENMLNSAKRGMNWDRVEHYIGLGAPELAAGEFSQSVVANAYEESVVPIYKEIVMSAARAGMPTIPRFQKAGTEVEFFTLTNPQTLAAIAREAAQNVTLVTYQTKAAIRAILEESQRLPGLTVQQQAARIEELLRRVKRSVGITEPQVRTLARMVAQWQADGLSETAIASLEKQTVERMIRHRSLVIARHETLQASNLGVHELWNQAVSEGYLGQNATREWLAQPSVNSDNPCPICRGLDGKTAPLGGSFTSDYNGLSYSMPPAHIQCLCVTVLSDPGIL